MKDLINSLIRVGEQMSNICDNLSQDRTIDERHRRTMCELRREWDAALSAYSTHTQERKQTISKQGKG